MKTSIMGELVGLEEILQQISAETWFEGCQHFLADLFCGKEHARENFAQFVLNTIDKEIKARELDAFLDMDAGLALGCGKQMAEAGLETVLDVMRKTEAELLGIRGVGPKTLFWIKKSLSGFNLHLADARREKLLLPTPDADSPPVR